jgi:predicted AAA+ superfamily ATPase
MADAIRTALTDTPAVLLNGPRQSGKTTLARQFASAERPYFSLDDPAVLAAVKADAVGFVRRLDQAVLDEVQRAPELLLALKLSIDADRRPGRFLLTGSANILALPRVADSLAGRMEILTLLPLSQSELLGRLPDFLDRAWAQDWSGLQPLPDGTTLHERVLAGGFPEVLRRTSYARREAWARAYVTALIERDVRDVAQLDQVGRMPRLLAVAAELSAQMLNLTQIGGQIGLDAKTVARYLDVLEALYLVRRVPPWSHNRLKRLVKTPKLHFIDAGLQAMLTQLTPAGTLLARERFGATLETWVYGELLKTIAVSQESIFLSYFRDGAGHEVDFVLESPQRGLLGIEVKASASVESRDFQGLRWLAAHLGPAFTSGVVLYDGQQVLPFGERLWAVPLAAL